MNISRQTDSKRTDWDTGLTPQYKDLQALYDSHKDKGLEIIGFPCNQASPAQKVFQLPSSQQAGQGRATGAEELLRV